MTNKEGQEGYLCLRISKDSFKQEETRISGLGVMGWVEAFSKVLSTEEAELIISATSLSVKIGKLSSSIDSPMVEEGSSRETILKASVRGHSREI